MCICVNLHAFLILVPNSTNVTVTAPSSQIVGQSLMLECSVTTVRGITSRVDMEWSTGNKTLQIIKGIVNLHTTNDSVLYKAKYNITQVSTLDDSEVYQCKVIINANPQLTAFGSITLDVTGNNLELLIKIF